MQKEYRQQSKRSNMRELWVLHETKHEKRKGGLAVLVVEHTRYKW
jgi:hypothetical protein